MIFLKDKVSKRVTESWLVRKNNPDFVNQLMNSMDETRGVWKLHIYLKNETGHVKLRFVKVC